VIETPEPGVEPAAPGRRGGVARGVGAGLALAALIAGVFTLTWWVGRLPYPTRAELQAQTAATVGQAEHTTVAARCEEPDDDGARCLLRDREGRYGYAVVSFSVDYGEADGPQSLNQRTSWGFPLDAQGRLEEPLEVKPPWDLSTSISRAVLVATYALGDADLATRVTCPQPGPGVTVTCTAAGQAASARLRQIDATHYVLSATFTLTTTDAIKPPTG
jgi:hypothetical protein